MSSVIVDPNKEEAYVDMDAMHARSKIERRVKYFPDKEVVADGLLYWSAWVTVEKSQEGAYFAGVTASELRIDKTNKQAYKSMPEHVTLMVKSLKGKIVLDHMDDKSRKLICQLLKDLDENMLENSSDELKSICS